MNDEKDNKVKEPWTNKANGTHITNEPYGTNGVNGTHEPQGTHGKPLEPKPFLAKKGNYRSLLVFKKAECLYDITYYFAHHYFVERKDRTIDQVVQAARSGKQNIIEGCAAASTSSETEIKLLGVARASMHEVLADYEDYLRTRHLEQWDVEDPRTKQIQKFSRKHNRPEDYTKGIDKRSPETLCNIAITLIHQFDNMMGRLLDRLQKDFVENGGIREQMTAARLGYRNDQKARIAELEAENAALKARIAELEQKVRELMRPTGLKVLIGPIGLIGLMRLIGLIGLMGLMGCSSSSEEVAPEVPPTPVVTEVPISFSGSESQEEAVSRGTTHRAHGANEANEANGAHGTNRRAAGTPLSKTATQFKVWGYKNMSFESDVYGTTQTVFPGYQVDWHDGSAATTTTNSSGWEYVMSSPNEQTIKYWDWSAKAYRFFAVTEGTTHEANEPNGPHEFTMTANASPVRDGEGTPEEKIAANIAATPYFSKLWFSTGNVSDYPDKQFGKPVQLEFLKPYARVRFIFKYAYPREGIKLSAKNFAPTSDYPPTLEEDKVKIARKGAVTVHYPIEGSETKEWYTTVVDADKSTRLAALTEDYDPEDDGKTYSFPMTEDGWYVVLPVNTQGSYTLSVSVNGQTKTAVVPAEYMTWQPGYSYTYVFKITDEGGVEIGWVEYAVTPWTEMETDRTVYNW